MPKYIKCRNCNNVMLVDVTSDVLHCEHCGKKYKNPFYKPKEDVEEVVLIEETMPQEECFMAPEENDVGMQESVESTTTFVAPSPYYDENLQATQNVLHVPKKGVAVTRLIFAIIAFIGYIRFAVQLIVNYSRLGSDSWGAMVFTLIGDTIIGFVFFIFVLVNLITAAKCISGNKNRMEANRSDAIASCVLSLLITIYYFVRIVMITASGVTSAPNLSIMICLGMIPNLFVFIFSCICASQVKRVRKHPEEFYKEIEVPIPINNTPQETRNEIVVADRQTSIAPVPCQAQQTAYVPANVATQGAVTQRAKSEFYGGLWSYIGLKIGNFFIKVFTLGLCVPWTIRREYTWLYEHQIIDGRKLEFTGNAASLFGQWVKWLLLSIVTLGIYAWTIPIKKMQWITENTHIMGLPRDENNNQSQFDGTFWPYFGQRILNWLIKVCTLGICEPISVCRMERWELEHKYIDGQRLVLDGSVGSFFGHWIKWWLLSAITFGIYSWWIPIKKQKWITAHTHFE